MNGGRRSFAEAIGDTLDRAYERHGDRWIRYIVIGGIAALMLVLGPFALWNAAHYQGYSLEQYLVALAVAELFIAGMVAWVIFSTREVFTSIAAFRPSESQTTEVAERALAASFEFPAKLIRASAIRAFTVALPVLAVLVTLPNDHFTLLNVTVVLFTVSIAICTALGILYYGAEVLMRPLRTRLGQAGATLGRPAMETGASLANRLFIGLLLMTVLAGFIVGTFTLDRGAAGDGVAKVLLISFGSAVGFGSTVALVIALSILVPVRDLTTGTRAVAAGNFATRVPISSTDELGELAASFNEMVGEVGASRARIVTASDDARRRVERDLHDGAQQSLVLLNLKLGLAERSAQAAPETRRLVAEARADLERALDELRDLAHGIYPAVLTSDGLPGALADAVEQAAITASLECDGAGRYSPEIEAAVYFCCLEALQNATKHAGNGAGVTVKLRDEHGDLCFEVADDGVGFEIAGQANGSAGLQNMVDRIGALGGRVRIESAPGAGTTVRGNVPVES